jgi:hypothetical protein
MGAILPAGDALGAVPEGPRTFATWTIANESWFGQAWFQPADTDVIVVNAGGIVHCDANWTGADGSRALNGITVNAGGSFIQTSSILTISDTYAITINEGGQWRSVGTSGSRCAITYENGAVYAFYFGAATVGGGLVVLQYTDISEVRYGFQLQRGGLLYMYNSTLTCDYGLCIYQNNNGYAELVNCTLTAGTASQYILYGAYSLNIKSVNTAFVSATDNYLATAIHHMRAEFAGCTFAGGGGAAAPISADDFRTSTQDIDIRIYEASTVTSDVSTASWALRHDEMDSTGMITTPAYTKVPGYLAYGQGSPSTIYCLNWTGFWPSGTSVANRVLPQYTFNYSNGAAAESGTNAKWNITASDWGYYTNSTTVWSGTNATVNLTAIVIPPTVPPGLEGDCSINTYDDGTHTNIQANYTWGADMFAAGLVQWNADIDDVYANATLYNSTGTELAWWNATYDFTAGAAVSTDTLFGVGLSYDTSNAGNGTFYLLITFENSSIETTSLSVQYAVLSSLIPGLREYAFIGTYDTLGDFRTNYTWGEVIELEGDITTTYDLAGAYVNLTVRDASGATVLWLGNHTETYTAATGIQLSTTAGGVINVDTSLLVNGSYVAVATIEHSSMTATNIYGGFHVMAEAATATGSGDFAAAANVVTYSDAATTIPCNNFTFMADVVINGTITTNGNLTNASVIIGLYNSTGFLVILLNVTWNFTASIEYNITEINGGIILFWQANASGQYHILLNITNATAFYNTTVTTEGFWVRAYVAPGVPTIIKPMVNYDLTPVIQLVEESAGNILTGFIIFIILLIIGISWRVSQKKGPVRWSVGPVTLRYSSNNRRK